MVPDNNSNLLFNYSNFM